MESVFRHLRESALWRWACCCTRIGLLLSEGYDDVKDQTFYRGLGGEIEFGEAAADALVREFHEELGRAVEVRASLGVVENRFTLLGAPGHEVIFEYLVAFAPGEAPPDFEPLEAREGEAIFTAKWFPPGRGARRDASRLPGRCAGAPRGLAQRPLERRAPLQPVSSASRAATAALTRATRRSISSGFSTRRPFSRST